MGYAFEAGQAAVAFEVGPGFAWTETSSPDTNLLGKLDVSVTPSDRWELFLEYEPTYIFDDGNNGLEHVLKGGVIVSF